MIRLTALAQIALALCAATPAMAQEIGTCDDWRSSVAMLAEPWEENSKVFAEGAVRLALIDTFEPAAAAFHLVILSPPYDELGFGQCKLVSGVDGMGFAGLNLAATKAEYDPAKGLMFTIPASRWLMETDSYVDAVLHVTLNQETGDITAVLE